MNGAPQRWDAWAQWALLVLTLLGFGWNLSGRLARIEQALLDDSTYRLEETSRVQALEQQINQMRGAQR